MKLTDNHPPSRSRMPLKYRVLTIIGLCLVSVWFLFPRNVTRRERAAGRNAP